MFLFNHVRYLRLITKSCGFTTGSLFSWDKTTGRVIGTKSLSRTRFLLKLKLLLQLANVFAIFLQDMYLQKQTGRNRSSSDQQIVSALIQNFGMCIILLFTLYNHGAIIPAYINGHLDFRNIFSRSDTIVSTTLEKLNTCFGYFNSLMVPLFEVLFLHALHWLSPCKASLVGYWLKEGCGTLQKESSWNNWHLLVKVFVFLWNFYIIHLTISLFSFCFAGVLIFSTLSFRTYMISYQKLCQENSSVEYLYERNSELGFHRKRNNFGGINVLF